jgi:hypothetical protein
MSDLTERLRNMAEESWEGRGPVEKALHDAADRIEELEAALHKRIAHVVDLEAALRELRDAPPGTPVRALIRDVTERALGDNDDR